MAAVEELRIQRVSGGSGTAGVHFGGRRREPHGCGPSAVDGRGAYYGRPKNSPQTLIKSSFCPYYVRADWSHGRSHVGVCGRMAAMCNKNLPVAHTNKPQKGACSPRRDMSLLGTVKIRENPENRRKMRIRARPSERKNREPRKSGNLTPQHHPSPEIGTRSRSHFHDRGAKKSLSG